MAAELEPVRVECFTAAALPSTWLGKWAGTCQFLKAESMDAVNKVSKSEHYPD